MERLIKIGAIRYPWRPHDDFVVLEDPDGDLFCVVQVEDSEGEENGRKAARSAVRLPVSPSWLNCFVDLPNLRRQAKKCRHADGATRISRRSA